MIKKLCTNCKYFGNFNGYDSGCDHKNWRDLPFQNHEDFNISDKKINEAAKFCNVFKSKYPEKLNKYIGKKN